MADDRQVRALTSLCSEHNCFYGSSPMPGYGVLDKQETSKLEKLPILELQDFCLLKIWCDF